MNGDNVSQGAESLPFKATHSRGDDGLAHPKPIAFAFSIGVVCWEQVLHALAYVPEMPIWQTW